METRSDGRRVLKDREGEENGKRTTFRERCSDQRPLTALVFSYCLTFTHSYADGGHARGQPAGREQLGFLLRDTSTLSWEELGIEPAPLWYARQHPLSPEPLSPPYGRGGREGGRGGGGVRGRKGMDRWEGGGEGERVRYGGMDGWREGGDGG